MESDAAQPPDARHDELIARLAQQVDNPALEARQRELAGAWRRRLAEVRARALAPLTMAFMAEVGCGKTTAIAAATGLRLEDVAPDKPKKWSVLPVDDGRTTVGDTIIELEAREDIELEVQPVGARALATELRLFALDHWAKFRGGERGAGSGGAGEEFFQLLRHWIAPDSDDPRATIEVLARAAEDQEGFCGVLERRVDVAARTQALRRDYDIDSGGLVSLRADLRALMRGRMAGAPAPQTLRVRVPVGSLDGALARIVDTRGIDSHAPAASIRGRPDLHRYLFEPDTLIVVCSSFASAPDLVSRELVETLCRDELGRKQAFRLLLVHPRDPDADAEEQAEHARARRERLAQCHDQLERAELGLGEAQVVALDARFEVEALQAFILRFAEDERRARMERWTATCDEVEAAMAVFADVEFAAAAQEWDLRLWWAWDAAYVRGMAESQAPAFGPATTIGLRGVATAISAQIPTNHHWSQLYAATRRRGRHRSLDLAKIGAVHAAARSLGPEIISADSSWQLASVGARAELARVREHLELRSLQFQVAMLDFFNRMVAHWEEALRGYFDAPEAEALWRACIERWSQGPGYVEAVSLLFWHEADKVELVPPELPDIHEFYDALPPRPPLFRLHRVGLQNFRGIVDQAVTLDPHVTVLVGDNGEGKTTWLEAIAAGVGAMLPAMDSGEPAPVIDGEVRQTKRLLEGVLDVQPQPPMRIDLTTSLQGHELQWSRIRSSMSEGVETIGEGLQVICEQIAQEVREHSERQLPLFAYYGTERLWPPDLEPRDSGEDNRFEGYRSCLDPASTHERVLTYVQHYTLAGLQRQKPFAQVEAICAAVVACIEGAVEFRWDLQRKDFLLILETGEAQLFRQLSDGYRNIVGLVADIAWRAVRLNPQLGARAPALAEGIVLIDEIDLHLHPRWQRRVLGDLRRAFPKLQFVTTTHSPFIIQSLEPGQLRNLAPDAQDYDYAHASPEDITEHVMGVELPQRSHRREREAEVARCYFVLLEELDDADDTRLVELERELAELIAPYSDNQAFVAELRSEYLAAKSRRGS